jgi:hypothetical protein
MADQPRQSLGHDVLTVGIEETNRCMT